MRSSLNPETVGMLFTMFNVKQRKACVQGHDLKPEINEYSWEYKRGNKDPSETVFISYIYFYFKYVQRLQVYKFLIVNQRDIKKKLHYCVLLILA